jgi:hypothetical protein
MVSRNTLGAATIPSIFSQKAFSPQCDNVGNNVDKRTYGGGRTLEGHHRGIFAVSSDPKKRSPWYIDSGDALGDGKRKLGAREELRDENG